MHAMQNTSLIQDSMSAQDISTYSISAFNEVNGYNYVSGWVSSCLLVERVRENVLCHETLCHKVCYEEWMDIIWETELDLMSINTSQVLQQSKSDMKLMEEEKRKDRGGTVRTMEGLTVTERHKSCLQSKERVLRRREKQNSNRKKFDREREKD